MSARRDKDRSILTEANEANEGLSNAQPNPGRKPFVTFCKISSECLLTAASPEEKRSVSKPDSSLFGVGTGQEKQETPKKL